MRDKRQQEKSAEYLVAAIMGACVAGARKGKGDRAPARATRCGYEEARRGGGGGAGRLPSKY